MMCTWFHCGVLGFGCQGWLQSRICLRDQLPLKALDLKTHLGFHTYPYSSLLEKEHPSVASDKEALGSLFWTSLNSTIAYLLPVAFVLYPLL